MNYLTLAKWFAPPVLILGALYWAFEKGEDYATLRLTADHTQTLASLERAHQLALQDATYKTLTTERALTAAMATLDAEHTQELTDAKLQADRDIAAVRAGELRLRNRFTCDAAGASGGRGATDASASVGNDAGSSGLQTEDAEFLLRFAGEADAVAIQLRACQAIVRGDRQ